MAWISVHEEAIRGHKLRSLSKAIGCSQNEALGILVRLWLWGINNADKTGRIVDASISDIAEVMTVGCSKDFCPEDIVNAMIDTGWLDSDDDELYIHDWEDWQKQWYSLIDTREKNKERKRLERMKKRDSPEVADNPPAKTTAKKTSKKAYAENFEQWWSKYPRKVGKGEAYKKYCARLNDGWSEDELYAACCAYADECEKRHTEMQYVKHPKTFLSETTPFADYIRRTGNTAATGGNEDDPYASWRV